jgi:hypothetical protein
LPGINTLGIQISINSNGIDAVAEQPLVSVTTTVKVPDSEIKKLFSVPSGSPSKLN